MNIVIFGGSFNPIHIGHMIIAETVSQLPDVDEVWIMVSPQNPLKSQSGLASEEDRLRLAEKALERVNGVKVSDFEFTLSRPSYTYKTLCELKRLYPQHEFRILIGSDNWDLFSKWRNSEEILRQFGVIVYQRPDCRSSGPFPDNVKILDGVPLILLSSTYIRNKIKEGKDVRFMIPDVIYEDTLRIYGK
ncbi:MAG: nicotinate-nucleotide adenylyltransferase [Muribaculaceae bacterium]|nr:nicotinate-nucleotide adenylyltransferase [Muribaculaceae bacterium]